ncbi:MAG: site-2 protease family protein [Candidatus Brocadiales bacterium]
MAPGILFALTIHEFSHGWVANRLGDPTARLQGRLTLNPIAHLDLFGTLCFIFAGIGWAKPVPVNPHNFKNPRKDDILVSVAGPVSNFISAFALGMIFRLVYAFDILPPHMYMMLFYGIRINLILAFFNLIPVFPLDGSHVLKGFLPRKYAARYENFSHYGPFILLGLIMLGHMSRVPILGSILYPPTNFFSHLFAGI